MSESLQCTNCAAASKRCDEIRPCERCIKYGLADLCHNRVRRGRKKGIKRGPYKQKTKSGGSSDGTIFAPSAQQTSSSNAAGKELPSLSQPDTAPTSTTTPSAAIHALVQFAPGLLPPGPEGYYSYYYPPPHRLMPPPPGQDGHPDGSTEFSAVQMEGSVSTERPIFATKKMDVEGDVEALKKLYNVERAKCTNEAQQGAVSSV
jgi:hypothetical protein